MDDVQKELAGLEVAFCIPLAGGRKGGVTLRPRHLCSFSGSYEGDYLQTEVTMHTPEEDITGGDYLRVSTLIECQETLAALRSGRPMRLDLWSIDGGFDFELFWSPGGQDVCLRCHFPSRMDYSRGEGSGPLYKGEIIERRSYEFYLDPEELGTPLRQIQHLVQRLRALHAVLDNST